MDYLSVLVTFLLLWQNIMTKKLTEGSICAGFKFQKVRTMVVKQRHGIRSLPHSFPLSLNSRKSTGLCPPAGSELEFFILVN